MHMNPSTLAHVLSFTLLLLLYNLGLAVVVKIAVLIKTVLEVCKCLLFLVFQ